MGCGPSKSYDGPRGRRRRTERDDIDSDIDYSPRSSYSGGGCFGPASTVQRVTHHGSLLTTPVTEVVRGDLLRVSGGMFAAEVLCVVKIERPLSRKLMKHESGLEITGGHPLKFAGEWSLPRELAAVDGWESGVDHGGYVYNFILRDTHGRPPRGFLLVNGFATVTLGEAPGERLPGKEFFGGPKVIDAASQLPGYDDGEVTVTLKEGWRPSSTNAVEALEPHELQYLVREAVKDVFSLLPHRCVVWSPGDAYMYKRLCDHMTGAV